MRHKRKSGKKNSTKNIVGIKRMTKIPNISNLKSRAICSFLKQIILLCLHPQRLSNLWPTRYKTNRVSGFDQGIFLRMRSVAIYSFLEERINKFLVNYIGEAEIKKWSMMGIQKPSISHGKVFRKSVKIVYRYKRCLVPLTNINFWLEHPRINKFWMLSASWQKISQLSCLLKHKTPSQLS